MALSRHQKKVAKTIIKVGRKKGATAKELKAAIETGLVESNLTNIKGGDRDSSGWRQERASSYPGKNRNDVKAGASRFFNETRAVRGKYKKSGDLAQAVQRSAFPGKYAQRGKEAQQILRKLDKGGGGSSGGGSAVDKGINLPGVDRSDQRKQIVAQYLLSRNQEQDPDDKYGLKQSNSMLQMLVALKQAGDTSAKTIRVPGAKSKGGSSSKVRDGGGWAGTEKLVKGATPGSGSGKRSPANNAAVGGAQGSDHLTTNRRSFAEDIGAAGARGDRIAKKTARRLGIKGNVIGTYNRHTVKVGGRTYSVQILWKVKGHHDHVHVGARRVK
jgi:hypothetical protein